MYTPIEIVKPSVLPSNDGGTANPLGQRRSTSPPVSRKRSPGLGGPKGHPASPQFTSTCGQLRLQEARQMLLPGYRSASDVAYSVGYEGASQFSREYLRQFGAPPARSVRQIRQTIARPPMN